MAEVEGSKSAVVRWAPMLLVIVVALLARWLSWPGFATHDTLFVVRDALVGEYTTYHPLLNGLLLRVLAIPLESFALYTSLQIVLCITLLWRALSLVVISQRSNWVTWLSVLLWSTALHTFLYLGVVWKDVPIAYGLSFMAALAYRVRTDKSYAVTKGDSVLLGISLVAAICLRHGMLFTLFLVPLLFGVGVVRRDKRLWMPMVAAGLAYVVLSLMAHSSIVRNDDAHMTKLKIAAISQPFLGIVSNRNGYTSNSHEYDQALATRVFGPDYAQAYSPDYFRNEVVLTGEEELQRAYRDVLWRTPKLCLMNVATCVSGRVQMMLGTMQPATKIGGMKFYDLGSMPGCTTVYGMDAERCELLAKFESGEQSSQARQAVVEISRDHVEERGLFANLWLWNLLPALVLLAALLVLMPAGAELWRVAVFFVVQMGLPFATAMANDFRYYYFLSIFLVVFGPVSLQVLLQAVTGRLRNRRSSQ